MNPLTKLFTVQYPNIGREIEDDAIRSIGRQYPWIRQIRHEWLPEPNQEEPLKTLEEVLSDPNRGNPFNLEHTALESPVIKLNHIASSKATFESDLRNSIRCMAGNLAFVWRGRAASEFCRIAANKVVTDWLSDQAITDILTELKNNDAEVGARVITAPSVKMNFQGLIREDDWDCARWEKVGDQWVEIPPYKIEDRDGRLMAVPNEAFRTALYVDTMVFTPHVFKLLHSKPRGHDRPAEDFIGETRWISEALDNPDCSSGFFRTVLNSASQPIRPELGWVIRHRLR